MAIFDSDLPPLLGANLPELSVSELAQAIKRVLEGEFAFVRVRGEIGRVSRPSSGHVYFSLKDPGATIEAVVWRGTVGRLAIRPEEGLEVVATGRLTTFPGASRYQLIVEALEPAGMGALMALLEARKRALAAEGLFDQSRKKPIPFLPQVIGVVTSPSGAVIRDILHRLADRFPRRVILWPVSVQGATSAAEVAAAIRGFNALPNGGPIPRPDVIIVARGGGSVEDLWGFNEEIVVRAAAESAIPLISAVGHETDTTLIDFAADLRAPTPTAAAELAVPVRADLVAQVAAFAARLARSIRQGVEGRMQRLSDLSRALPRPELLLVQRAQRLDLAAGRLAAASKALVDARALALSRAGSGLRPRLLAALLATRAQALAAVAARLQPALRRSVERRADRLQLLRLSPEPISARIAREAPRLAEALTRARAALNRTLERLAERLAALDRQRRALGFEATLARGFALIRRPDGTPITQTAALRATPRFWVELADGRTEATPRSRPARGAGGDPPKQVPKQGHLFDP